MHLVLSVKFTPSITKHTVCTLTFVVVCGCCCGCRGGVEDGDVEVGIDEDGGGEEERDHRHREDRSQGPAHSHLEMKKFDSILCNLILLAISLVCDFLEEDFIAAGHDCSYTATSL